MNSILALLPAFGAVLLLCVVVRDRIVLARGVAALACVQLAVAAAICGPVALRNSETVAWDGFRMDAVGALFVLITTLVVAASLTHAAVFFEREASRGHAPTLRQVRQFYASAALFVVAMYGVVLSDNLGFLWISMEATTLLSAPLVYYHRSRVSLEATWKYLIICSVAITFAFFGTALFYAASQRIPGLDGGSLLVSDLIRVAPSLPHGLLRLGFVFTLLGYGTKAGLFPLHSWLPDAHSEAPAPASAMLSGALLNCALVALWRACQIMTAAGDGAFVQATLLPMGGLTVLAASLFLIRQQDVKRLWAYSSMENIGLMAVAVGLGSTAGFALQAVNHSLVKVALFLLAGNLLQQYGTKNIRDLRGLLSAQPLTAMLLLAGGVAVAGTPPFGSFLAEWRILSIAADGGHSLTVGILVAALAIAFIAVSLHLGGMLFGEAEALSRRTERLEVPAWGHLQSGVALVVPIALVAAALWLGLAMPALNGVMQ